MKYDSTKNVIRMCYRIIALYSREFGKTGRSFTESYVMILTGLRPGITASLITEYMDHDKGYISRVLAKLSGEGLIRSGVSAGRGTKPLFLTEKGKKLFDELEEKADKSIEQHVSGAGAEDRDEFFRLMDALDENFRVVCPDEFGDGQRNG